MYQIKFAQSEKEIGDCWEVVHLLRPHLDNKEAYIRQVKEMKEDGYHMLYIAGAGSSCDAAAFAGYRNLHSLHGGRYIYIDDLCTLPAYRGKGYAGALLDYIQQLARETNKTGVVLDSGFQLNDAHRLYLNKGYKLSAHHFSLRF
ncbi:GNAT family N-acetyltransferase [Chitinophaga agrisoli]|uniref:GNAT family N-acetyltransferase n=1 Tax=Chitinophaga agrisoli TaxID=2607653 RepID=A0A5B2VUW3_9BACT|nr:GNAT family N-acetyltransferase [Chitinophaga agrisoli]KAA2242564.1 GNAT family N-acetyltransferase [Chitinophaga agrisoli]